MDETTEGNGATTAGLLVGLLGAVLASTTSLADPVMVGHWPDYIREQALSVTADGDRAYVAAGSAGFYIFDVQDRHNVRKLSNFDVSDNCWGLTITSGKAYLANGSEGLI